MNTFSLRIDRIFNDFKIMPAWRTIRELYESMKKQGQLHPIVVREVTHGERYEIVSGYHRVIAAKLIGLQFIDAIIQPPTWDVRFELYCGTNWEDRVVCELKNLADRICRVHDGIPRCYHSANEAMELYEAAKLLKIKVHFDMQEATYFLRFAGVDIGIVHIKRVR